MFKKLVYSLHRILGSLLSILFLVWFLSGFVMIYHTFPKAEQKHKYEAMEGLPERLPIMDSIGTLIPVDQTIKRLRLQYRGNQPIFSISTDKQTHLLSIEGKQIVSEKISFEEARKYARRYYPADIQRVDTLYELEQWIPFSRYRQDMPIYKFYYGDTHRHRLYVSSATGEALQFTNKKNRFWSWLGAIPHWIYFTGLRQDAKLWADVIIWLSGTGCIMCIAGIILGIRSCLIIYRKKKKWKTPYKKPAYKWHHILGFFFGIFVFAFIFSGMMSLAAVPQWIAKEHNQDIKKKLFEKGYTLPLNSYLCDYENIPTILQQKIKSVEWSSFGELPIYKVIAGNSLFYIDASIPEGSVLHLSEEEVIHYLNYIHTEKKHVSLLYEYDNYYISRRNELPLPVYKVQVDDPDKSTYYIHPKTGDIRYFNTNSRVRKWTYQALHSFSIKGLTDKSVLWNIVMWTTMITGTIISLTGVILGIRYFRKILRRFFNIPL